MAQVLHTATEELLFLKQPTPAATVPLLDPAQDAQHLFSKLTADDVIKAFVGTFERVTMREGWPPCHWSGALAPLLSREAQWTYYAFPEEERENYSPIKDEILAHWGPFELLLNSCQKVAPARSAISIRDREAHCP